MYFLYLKTTSVDYEKHNILLDNFNQFMLVDSILNQDILEIRQGLLAFYDPTVGKTNTLKNLTINIKNTLEQTQEEHIDELLPLINELSNTVAIKSKHIEKFKSTNAIFTNSLRYLPTATHQLSEKLPLNSQGDVVTLLLTEQLRDILIHNYSNDSIILDKFNKTNKLLKSIFKENHSELLTELNSLQSHATTIIINKKLIDDIINEILQTPTSKTTNKLLHKYLSIYNQKILLTKSYQQALYILSVLLLIYIGYVLYKLNNASQKLKNTIKDLNYQKFAMDQHAIVSITDANGIITYANQKFCEISGFTKKEITGKTYSIIKSNFHSQDFFAEYKNTQQKGDVWHGAIRNKTKDNHYFWVETTSVPFINERGKAYQFVTIQTDITNIKDAKKTLQLQSAALEVAANGIVITDQHAHILWVNQAFSDITGYSLEEAINQTPKILNSGKQDASFFENMWETILDGKAWHGELINQRKNGELYSEELTISPVLDSAGEISHFISIKQDISKRRAIEEALRRSQKMDAIGQLSGGIAHDFNNQLSIILGYLDIIQNTSPTTEQIGKYAATATIATSRCVELTRQLLAFSRKQPMDVFSINLNRLLKDQQIIIARSVTPQINIEYFLADDLWITEINPGEFDDAIINMAINSRDAMPNGGNLSIETSNKTIDKSDTENNGAIAPGDYVKVSIIDTGSGMDEKTLEHIFEPFFTTKSVSKGTGLGMSMVYGFVERYKGHINIKSELNTGTSINLFLPRSRKKEEPKKSISKKNETPSGNETILIVDDEADLLNLANNFLQSLGYNTYTAIDAKQALKTLSSKKDIQMLFSDVVMPGSLNGYELAKKATEIKPDIKILLTSGFTSQSISKNNLDHFSNNLLNKPYRKNELAERVRLVFDEK